MYSSFAHVLIWINVQWHVYHLHGHVLLRRKVIRKYTTVHKMSMWFSNKHHGLSFISFEISYINIVFKVVILTHSCLFSGLFSLTYMLIYVDDPVLRGSNDIFKDLFVQQLNAKIKFFLRNSLHYIIFLVGNYDTKLMKIFSHKKYVTICSWISYYKTSILIIFYKTKMAGAKCISSFVDIYRLTS